MSSSIAFSKDALDDFLECFYSEEEEISDPLLESSAEEDELLDLYLEAGSSMSAGDGAAVNVLAGRDTCNQICNATARTADYLSSIQGHNLLEEAAVLTIPQTLEKSDTVA